MLKLMVSTVVGGCQLETILCHCRIRCRTMPSTKPPMPDSHQDACHGSVAAFMSRPIGYLRFALQKPKSEGKLLYTVFSTNKMFFTFYKFIGPD
jgi:hypothetical protein